MYVLAIAGSLARGFVALAIAVSHLVAAADAPTAPGARLDADARAAPACSARWREDPKAYRAVVRTREYRYIVVTAGPGARIAMRGPDAGELEKVGDRCLALIAVYVDHQDRLEMRMLFGVDPRSYSVFVQDLNGDFKPVRGKEELVPATTILAQAPPAPARDWASVNPARQGYSREQSAAMLDPQVRQFLDGILRLYKEEGLFTDRAKALQLLDVTHTTRRWSNEPTLPGRYPHYFDTFSSEGVFARPGWAGEYAYRSHGADPETWHVLISITIDAAKDCQSSRAVEGYLDLELDPGTRQQVHPVPERLFRHEVNFAQPYAPPVSLRTPQLSMNMSNGCVVALRLAKIFKFKEVSDALSRD